MRDSMVADRLTARAAAPARLEMRWMPVTDAAGRTRLEACWFDAGSVASAPATHHAA